MAKKRPKRKAPSSKRAAPKQQGKQAAKQQAKPAARQDKLSRTERLEARRRERRRRSTLVRLAVVGGLVVVLGAVAVWQVGARRNAQRTIAALTAGSCRYDTKTDPGSVNEHVPTPTFAVDPPSGGLHTPEVASAGTYDGSNAPEDGRVVHALEHGYVALWYRPDLAEKDLADLKRLAEAEEADVLLLPRPTMAVKVAATAWHRRLLCNELEVDTLRRFVDAYAGEGPEKVPRER